MTITFTAANGARTAIDRAALLGPELREAARLEANAWIKRLRLVRYGSRSMREQFTYKGDSLWWFTELYLHKMRRLDVAVETVLALGAAREAGARELAIEDGSATETEAALAFGRAHGVPVSVAASARHADRAQREQQSLMVGWTSRLSRVLRAPAPAPAARPMVAAFVHSAFWRSNDPAGETYVGPVLDALVDGTSRDKVAFVGLGPRRNFRVRRWWDPLAPAGASAATPIERYASTAAIAGSTEIWRNRRQLAAALTKGQEIRAAAVVLGVDLWNVLRPELEAAAMVQWPWSARTMDEAAAALDALKPQVIVTYAEAGGWGRALVLEARRRGIPSAGLQHGFIYRHWLNYLHEPDEMAPAGTSDRGFPRPDCTLLFDDYARQHLTTAGRFPPESLVVTGSPRLESLQKRIVTARDARRDTRARHGVTGERRLAVLAAKFTEIKDELPALVGAVAALPDVQLVIKPHPAETPALYAPVLDGRTNVAIAAAGADLAELLGACDVIVTMNSTVAIDGLVLGIPSLVIGLPNNLSPFVDAGVMLGANGAEKIQWQLESVLYDREIRSALEDRAKRFVAQHGLAPEPGSAQRTAAAILAAARGRHA